MFLEYYQRIADAVDFGVILYKRGPELTQDIITYLSTEEQNYRQKFAGNDIRALSSAVSDTPGNLNWIKDIAEQISPAFTLKGAEGDRKRHSGS